MIPRECTSRMLELGESQYSKLGTQICDTGVPNTDTEIFILNCTLYITHSIKVLFFSICLCYKWMGRLVSAPYCVLNLLF